MAKKRSHHARRYCEECGQPFESQQVDAYLCPQCFRLRRREKVFARKRQQARRQARAIAFGEQQDSSI